MQPNVKENRGAPTADLWIQSYTGKKISILDLDASQLDVRDIAESLSKLCRYNGHSHGFWSVAAHCVVCARVSTDLGLGREVTKWALLHDAHEYIIGDISSPVKAALRHMGCDAVDVLEKKLQDLVWSRFLRDTIMPREHIEAMVHDIDIAVLDWERRALMPNAPEPWSIQANPRYTPTWTAPKVLPLEEYRHHFLECCKWLAIS